ncbi:DUF2000 family protein [Epidermidibacterium keratini]|uniref:DUF2000 family protein n=1 Tax=Epidermidibacterium keratini TaxID=1891644 RepID=A0A7L4YKP7_9ACTN|nr:DUF2000 domain-containing protein [Epidermidibacterium keratini]QHB99709.1 DUF2000 family protein [Epidermidibacterium keratini]
MDEPRFPTNHKLVVVLREGLAGWQALNATAFLSSGLAAGRPDLIGEEYVDGSDQRYLAVFGQPVMVMSAPADLLRTIRERAVGRGLGVSIFIDDIFATGNDTDNRAAVAAVPSEALSIVGLGLVGPKNAVDKTTKGAQLYR